MIIDGAVIKTFYATPSADCTTATSLYYQVRYSPLSSTPNLISLSSSDQTTITFALSSNINDAKDYTVTVDAYAIG